MTESLYRITLSYLRKNRQLINFTKLNHQTTNDMFKIIKNKEYLSNVVKCRVVYNWGAIYSYLAKYHHDADFITCDECPGADDDIFITDDKQYVDDFYILEDAVYKISTDTIYYVSVTKNDDCMYYVTDINLVKKLSHMLQKSDYENYNQIVHCWGRGHQRPNLVHNVKMFKHCPDLIEWAVANDHMSEELFIYKDLMEKLLE
ncbi:Hypothetical protein PACV_369 [Pacmanvirus A23]|uniref:Hypothetical protein n=1 Tax=Pacmanvirus A23 TaxID=1932881 RepID=UPI000A096177|nr:Hypothetical protein B9W72_gp365 [Pacmanvirus A23]SIP86082.1 Hypothetical protein PACV_369 [Pacmanvirus A23]